MMMIDNFFIFILLSRESGGGAMRRTNPDSLRSCLYFQVLRLNFLLTSTIKLYLFYQIKCFEIRAIAN